MRCFGIVRTIIVIVTCGSYTWSYGVHFIVPEKTLVISRRWPTLWIGYCSGRKTSAIQLYLADLH